MKKILLTLAVLCSQAALAAEPEVVEIVRSKAEVPLTLDLNEKTVRCLRGDYSAGSLKISVPELRDYTVFRQTTAGETDPCINAGFCSPFPGEPGLNPGMVLNSEKPTEDVKITVTLKEVLKLDHEAKTCSRQLVETLSSDIRGLTFKHQDGASLGDTNYDVCLKMKN